MNKLLIIAKSVFVLIAMGVVGIVYAENEAFPYSSLNSWTGFYAGINGGFVVNHIQLRSQQLGFTNPDENCNISSNFSSFFPGIQLGYMYQFPNLLVSGIEANATFNTNQEHTLSCSCPDNPEVSDQFLFRNKLQNSIKGRVGHVLNWNDSILLPYLATGASFVNAKLTYRNEGGDYYSKNTTQAGWLIGAGLEWAFKHNWSLRLEYSYVKWKYY